MYYCRVCGNDDPDYKCKCAEEVNKESARLEISENLRNKARWQREKERREMLKQWGIEYN